MRKTSHGPMPTPQAPEKAAGAATESSSTVKLVATLDLASGGVVLNPAPNASPPRAPTQSREFQHGN